ncbi:MAG: TlpA disulfide reductase family protein [Acidobacteriota bacterium]
MNVFLRSILPFWIGGFILGNLPMGVYAQDEARLINPEFEVRLFDYTTVRADDIKGRIAVIDFWATWCKPCLAEVPDYNDFYRNYKEKGVVFLALAIDSGKEEKVLEAAKRFNMEYPTGAPSKKELKTIGKVRTFPTTWIVGPEGRIVREFVGVVSEKQEAIREIVDRLLAGEAP